MKDITYTVRIYTTEVIRGTKTNRHRVRWQVGDKVRRRNFHTAAQAESFRSELHVAARNGEAFTLASGEPVSWARSRQPQISWDEFVCQYVDMKWKSASAK